MWIPFLSVLFAWSCWHSGAWANPPLSEQTSEQSPGSSSCGPWVEGRFDGDCRLGAAGSGVQRGSRLELYSWRENGRWVFAIVPERKAGQLRSTLLIGKMRGVEELRARLDTLAPGTELLWNPGGVMGLAVELPSAKGKRAILKQCQLRELSCSLPSP